MAYTDPIQQIVGPVSKADGSFTPQRSDKQGATVVTQAHGKYYEASLRGSLFCASVPVAGTPPGTAIGTTAALVLYNPAGSGRRLAIQKVTAGYISGTLGAGTVFHCANGTVTQTAPSGGTAITPVCLDIGNGALSVAQARAGGTVVQPGLLRPFCSLTAELATTASSLFQLEEDIDGEIVLEPGTSYQLQGVAAAGTTPLMVFGVSWEELALV